MEEEEEKREEMEEESWLSEVLGVMVDGKKVKIK